MTFNVFRSNEDPTDSNKATNGDDNMLNDTSRNSRQLSTDIRYLESPNDDNDLSLRNSVRRRYQPNDKTVAKNVRPSRSSHLQQELLLIPDETHDPTEGIFVPDLPSTPTEDSLINEAITLEHMHTNNLEGSRHEKIFAERLDVFKKEQLSQSASPQEDKDYFEKYALTDKPVRREHFNEYKVGRDREIQGLMEFQWKITGAYRDAKHKENVWRTKYLDAEDKMKGMSLQTSREDDDHVPERRYRITKKNEPILSLENEEINEPYLETDPSRGDPGTQQTPTTPRHHDHRRPPEFLYPHVYLAKFIEVRANIKIMRLRALEVLEDWLSMQTLAQEFIADEAKQLNYAPLASRGYYYLGVAQHAQKHFDDAVQSFGEAQRAIGHYEEGTYAIRWLRKAQEAFNNPPSGGSTPLSARSGRPPPDWSPWSNGSEGEFWK